MFQFYNFTARHITDKGLQQTSNHTANLIEHQAIEVLLGIRYYYHYYTHSSYTTLNRSTWKFSIFQGKPTQIYMYKFYIYLFFYAVIKFAPIKPLIEQLNCHPRIIPLYT